MILERDQVALVACAAYHFLQKEHLKENPFFLRFGWDPVSPLNTLIQPQIC